MCQCLSFARAGGSSGTGVSVEGELTNCLPRFEGLSVEIFTVILNGFCVCFWLEFWTKQKKKERVIVSFSESGN